MSGYKLVRWWDARSLMIDIAIQFALFCGHTSERSVRRCSVEDCFVQSRNVLLRSSTGCKVLTDKICRIPKPLIVTLIDLLIDRPSTDRSGAEDEMDIAPRNYAMHVFRKLLYGYNPKKKDKS